MSAGKLSDSCETLKYSSSFLSVLMLNRLPGGVKTDAILGGSVKLPARDLPKRRDCSLEVEDAALKNHIG
jgi:hypothetical protein